MTYADMLRQAMGSLTPSELARMSGVTQPTIWRILNGAQPMHDTDVRLQRALPRLRELVLVKVVTG